MAVLTQSERIQLAVEAAASRYGAVGVQAAVIRRGHPAETYFYGEATKGTDPMTPMHKFRTASLTKVAIGIAVMLLRERGLLSLSDPLSFHWGHTVTNPYYPDMPITLRSCLTHTSSIYSFGPEVSRAYADTVELLLRPEGYTRAVPGDPSAWNYNNFVYSVLGMAVERTAQDFMDFLLDTSLWDRLGADVAMESGEVRDTGRLVTLYRQDGSVGRSVAVQKLSRRPRLPASTGIYFAGGMTASARDLARMVSVLVNDGEFEGEHILTPNSVAQLEQLQFRIGSAWQAQPLLYQENMYDRPGIYYHTGSAYGAYNLLSYDPDSGDGAVVLTSGALGIQDSRGIYAVCSEISRAIYDVLAGK